MKKRIFSILLTLCMVLCIVPTNVFAAEGTGTQYQAIHFNTKPLSSPTRVQNGKNIHFMPNSYIYFGNNGNNPIKWRVLDTDKSNDGKRNGMFMLSENLLDGNVKYDYIHGGSEYNGSDAQQWCKDFAANSNNFSGLEQEAMLPVEKTDNVERNLFDYTWDKCSLTNADKMFFPSIREVIDYIGNYDKAPGFIATDTSGNKGAWWLRSHPTGFTKAAGLIFDTGFVDVDNVNKLHSARPAFNLNKNDIRFISAAAGGKSVEGTNGGLAEIPAYSGNEWKLTLYDSSRRDFRVSTSAVSVTPDGGEISINYNDAKTGNNEYISAILFGQDGNVKYYGRSSTSVFSSNGSKTFRIPAGLAEGEYNFSVFSEQYNGDYKTDYIGNLFSVRFTVEKNPEEQFNLATGERYYFDLSAFDIPGQTNEELPESTLHYVPFIYAGTVNSYVLTTEAYMVAGSSEYASRITDPSLSSYGYTYPHSLFIAEHSVKTWVRWSELSMAGDYIYGKDYQSGGIDYNLRAPTVGSRGNNNGAAPLRNEWDRILDKNSKFIRNWQEYASWGQDTCYSHPYEKNHSLRRGDHRSSPRNIIDDFVCNKGCSYRPVLEIKNADALGKNGLRAVTLNLNGTTLGGEEKIKIAVQSNGSFAAPTSDGLTHPYGNSTGYFAWLGDNNRIYAPGESVPAHVTSLTAQWVKPEEFYLEYGVGDTYYFDLSGENIPGTVDSDLPDTSLHYVPFTYVGTIEAYKLKSSSTGVVEAAEIASKADDPESIYGYTQLHSLFIANYTLTNKVSWKELDQNGLIFGRNYASNGINYTLRAPSMGSTVDTTNGKIFPTNNEWDQILAKAPWYIKNMQIKSDLFLYWGQDTRYNNYGYEYMMLRYEKLTSNLEKDNVTDGAYRPVLEVQNVDALGKNGLKEVILYLGDYYFNDRRGINLMVKNGESFTAPSIDGLSLTDSVSEGVTQWWEDEGGNLYKPGDTVPASVEFLSLTHRYDVTYLPGAYGTGDTVTDAKFDGFYPLRLRDALFTRPGYTQTGWATTDGGERVYGLKDYYYANEVLTLYPVWSPNSYTITFDTDGGSEISPITQDCGSEITAPANPSKTGYTFVGWDKEIPTAMPAENITIKAQWKANSYTITFDTDGGSEISSITQDYGSEITAPDNPSKVGCTFVGWDKEIPAAMPAENITIKAQWKANSYTITFDSDGGSEISPITQDYGSEITAPANPSKTGYTFVGWDKEIPTAMPAENITIKAQWKANSYTITFDSDGGSKVESKTLSWNDKVLDGVAEPIRNGYSFIGWKYIDYIVYADTVYAELAADDSVNGITLKAEWRDVEKPTGEIIVSTNRWNKLLNDITFGLFFKETQMVTVNAADNSGEKVKIEYLLSNREITESELADAGFTEYDGSFSIAPDNEYIIYVRLSDTEGNIRHICSDGIVLDGTAPAINGVENGKTYCEAQTVKINEKYVSTVTVNGMAVALDEQDRFVLSPTEREQTIIVTDKAGNTSEITVTINNGHTYGDWSSNSDGTHTRRCGVDGCQAGVETKNCTDADKNHICDICGYIISECTDTDKNNICDYCGKTISEHEDEDKDHTCTDKDKNHICDYCGKAISEHEDEVKDHTCTDKDKNNICDYCGKAISEHEDEDKEIKKANTVAERLPDAPRSPKTGDNNSLILWIALLFISGGTVINTTVVTKKKRHNN